MLVNLLLLPVKFRWYIGPLLALIVFGSVGGAWLAPAGAAAAPAAPDYTVTFYPTQDTYVDEGAPTTAFGSAPDLLVGGFPQEFTKEL